VNDPANPAARQPGADATTFALRETVVAKVALALATHRPFAPDAPVVVAVSGGPDSLCLLGTLLALQRAKHAAAPGELVVASFDHGMRGAASAADAQWVADFAAARGLRCVVGQGEALALARDERLSLEDAARRLRYAFLRRVAAEVGAARICLGHTRDDQAETITLNWLRGAGLSGLSGMRPVEGDLVRPLLDVTHAETRAYCAAQGWQPCEDPTNTDPRYLRNRIRQVLLPALDAYNPNLRQTLARNADLIAEDERYLDAQTDAAWAATVPPPSLGLRAAHFLPPFRERERESEDGRGVDAPSAVGATDLSVMESGVATDGPGVTTSGGATDGATDGSGVAPSAITFALDALRAQPLALRRRLLRRAAQRLLAQGDANAASAAHTQPTQPLEARHIALLERLIADGHTGAALDLPHGLRARRDYTTLILERNPSAPHQSNAATQPSSTPTTPPPTIPLPVGEGNAQPAGPARVGAWSLPIPGALDIPALGWRLRAARIERPAGLEGDATVDAGTDSADDGGLPPVPTLAPIAQAGTAAQLPHAELRVYVDADLVGPGPLLVRAWRPGDRFMPLGMEHEKKLQDYFADARVPRALRTRLPVVVGPTHILWVATQRIDQRVRLTPATRHILALQCEPLP